MKPQEKPASSPGAPGGAWDSLCRVALVGAATLKGKELKEVLEERSLPAMDIRLLDDDESLGQLDAIGGEATFVQGVRRENFEHVDIAFFASDESFTRRHWRLARAAGCAVVDMSYALETEPEAAAVVRAPWVERELSSRPDTPAPEATPKLSASARGSGAQNAPTTDATPDVEASAVVVAHPAAVVLAMLLLRARRPAAIRRATVMVLEPVSERGRRGMDELHQQTVNLLSFQRMPTEVFDSQVAFNMVARYGEKASRTLESVERRVLSHFQQITHDLLPLPALMVVQAPIFHGHAFAIYVELEKKVSAGDFAQAIAGEHLIITRMAQDSPNNVNVAGRDHILVSLRRDANQENGLWIWAAADNLKIASITAADCAAALAAARPRGKLQ